MLDFFRMLTGKIGVLMRIACEVVKRHVFPGAEDQLLMVTNSEDGSSLCLLHDLRKALYFLN